MSITYTESASVKASRSWQMPFLIGALSLLALYTTVIWYQGWAGWKFGLDSTEPAFETYWMRLFYIQLTVLPIVGAGWWAYLWFTRDRHLDQLQPREELRRYFVLLGMIAVYVFAVYWGASYFAEQDGSWHQTVVRDTSFTPSHIAIFYLSFPIYIIIGVAGFIYSITRLPRFAERISIPYVVAVAGPFMILPNVGFNEWGHGFWIMEEWFTAPLHWGFVVLGWTALALFGLAYQIAMRIRDIIFEIGAVTKDYSPVNVAAE